MSSSGVNAAHLAAPHLTCSFSFSALASLMTVRPSFACLLSPACLPSLPVGRYVAFPTLTRQAPDHMLKLYSFPFEKISCALWRICTPSWERTSKCTVPGWKGTVTALARPAERPRECFPPCRDGPFVISSSTLSSPSGTTTSALIRSRAWVLAQ